MNSEFNLPVVFPSGSFGERATEISIRLLGSAVKVNSLSNETRLSTSYKIARVNGSVGWTVGGLVKPLIEKEI
jgi:hypothetical protein